jgi:hypothetical protein
MYKKENRPMKITWEADDIKVGRRVGKSGRKEEWIIGY